MALEPSGVSLVAEGFDAFVKDMGAAGQSVVDFGGAAANVAGGALKGFATAAGGAALVVGGTLVAGLGGAAAAGFSFNNSLEQAEAKINAFTKDAAVTADVLDMVRERAAKTPFAFEEMAGAAAALGPVAKSSGQELEGLIATAEILAASNPAEGLEGAAFAIKEAVSGDFTSVIERFNLSRSYLNQLKKEGVPALEAIGMAMKQAGYDADLVTALANTASGRLSTFKDTLTNIAGTVTQPLFDAFSEGLGKVNEELGKNTPLFNSVASSIGTALVPAATALGGAMAGAARGVGQFVEIGQALAGVLDSTASLDDRAGDFTVLAQAFGPEGAALLVDGVQAIQGGIAGIGAAFTAVLPAIQTTAEIAGQFGALLIDNWEPALAATAGVLSVALAPALLSAATAFGAAAVAAAPVVAVLGAAAAAGVLLYEGWTSNFLGIQDVVGEAFGTIGPLIAPVVDAFGNLMDAVGEAGPLSTEAGEAFGYLGTKLGEFISGAIPAVQSGLAELGGRLLSWAQEQAPGWLASLQQLGAGLAEWVVTAIPGMITSLMDARLALTSWVLDSLPEWAGQLGNLATALYEWVVDALPGLGTNLGQVAALLITKTGEFIAETGPKLLELGGRFVMWVAEEVLPKLPGQLASVAQALITGIGNFLTEIGPPLLDVATAFLEWVATEVLPALPGKMAEIGGAIVSGITTFAGSVVAESSTLGADLIAGMVKGVQNAASSLYNAVAGVVQRALGAGEKSAETGSPSRLFARELGMPISQGIALGITEAAGLVNEALGMTVTDGLDVAAGLAPGIGASVGDGMAKGIAGKVGAVASAAAKLAGAATGAAKKALNINSPSGVFADEVGAPIVAGMAQGMLGNLQVLLDAAGEISWAVLDEAKKFAATIQDAVGPLLAAGFKGAAEFARGQIGALDSLDGLMADPAGLNKIGQEGAKILDKLTALPDEFAAKRKKLEEEIAKIQTGIADDDAAARRQALEDELKVLTTQKKDADEELAEKRARLAFTAANNFDPEKRAQAQQELDELDAQGGAAGDPAELARIAAIKAELAELDQQTAAEAAAARDAEIARVAALQDELDALAGQEAQRREELKADAALNLAQYQQEEARFLALQAISDKAQADIAAVQAEALKLQDPAERAAFMKLRTSQIVETAQLEQRLANETDELERERITKRLSLLKTAQAAEFAAYQQEAQQRQTDQQEALRDAEDAIKQLGNLVFFSQADVFGQGQDMIRGIAAGMLSQAGALQSTLGGVLDEVLAQARRDLGIASPSRLFAEQIGGPLGAGIAAGFQAELQRATPAISASVTALVTPVQRAAAFATGGPSYTDNRSVSISAPGATAGTVAQIRQVANGVIRGQTTRSDIIRRTR